jgi:hypothetical protein
MTASLTARFNRFPRFEISTSDDDRRNNSDDGKERPAYIVVWVRMWINCIRSDWQCPGLPAPIPTRSYRCDRNAVKNWITMMWFSSCLEYFCRKERFLELRYERLLEREWAGSGWIRIDGAEACHERHMKRAPPEKRNNARQMLRIAGIESLWTSWCMTPVMRRLGKSLPDKPTGREIHKDQREADGKIV